MDEETKNRLADYFEAWDLVELLRIPTKDIIEAFEDEVENALEDLEEIMEITHE
jgi:hypothetical protein